ncbi:MAG TPA: hypothetical protein V6D11_19620 [Waterburya sp.]|jgi:hypothetical protein
MVKLLSDQSTRPWAIALWSTILHEAERYTEEVIFRLEAIWQQQYTDLS